MFELPPLKFPEGALEPHMSAETLRFHHGKHHKTYVDTLNELIVDRPLADMSLDDIILKTHADEDKATKKIFNNAAQHWNHSFFWRSLSPDGGMPTDEVTAMLDSSFGSLAKFKAQFKEAATGHFGSGWVWVVADGEALEIMTTHDADLPLADGKRALLTCDLWEHAYYLNYQNARPKFIDAFLEHLINWEFLDENFRAPENFTS